jgi:hypothetical protein
MIFERFVVPNINGLGDTSTTGRDDDDLYT